MNFLNVGSLLDPENPFKAHSRPAAGTAATLEGVTTRQPEGVDGSEWVPPVDVLEDGKEYLFKVDLPELEKSEIRVLVEREVLFITGTRSLEEQEKGKKSLRLERPHGYFVRRFALPADVSRTRIQARLAGGVLQVHVHKRPAQEAETDYPQQVEVKIATG